MTNENDIDKINSLQNQIQVEKANYDNALKHQEIEFWELKIIRGRIKSLRASLREYIQKAVKAIHKKI